MAIVTDTYYEDGQLFNRVYSNADRYVVRDGVNYTEARDPAEFGRIYVEGDLIPLEERDDPEEIIDIIFGG